MQLSEYSKLSQNSCLNPAVQCIYRHTISVQIYSHTSSDRLQLIEFYESELGQVIYSWRGISIEPLIEHIRGVFKIDPLPVRSYQKVAGLVLLSILLYQIIVYYNCKAHKEHPKAIKHMLGS